VKSSCFTHHFSLIVYHSKGPLSILGFSPRFFTQKSFDQAA
jgi:hypothetical protein